MIIVINRPVGVISDCPFLVIFRIFSQRFFYEKKNGFPDGRQLCVALAHAPAMADEITCPNVPVKTMSCKDSKGNVWEVTCVGTNEDDTITGTLDRDVIAGLNGNDKIDAGTGDDVVCGGNGDDEIDGGTGNNSLIGGNGNDTLYGSMRAQDKDYLEGGNGDDTLMSKPGDDTLTGDRGDDTLGGGPQ